MVELAERASSCEIYPLLKRVDEKYVTERAYNNPRFVEDIVREISLALSKDERITAFYVESENHESIHTHNAYALITRKI
jgi:GTP cyclohydrolase FolE2